MTPEALVELYTYTYWAFDRVWACITHLSDEQFTYPLAYSTGSIRNHVVHLMSGTSRWLKRIQGVEVPPHLDFEEYPTRAVVRYHWDIYKAATLDYISSLDQVQIDEVILWEIPTRNLKLAHRRWELLLHVANHATDHRAQILAMLHTQFGVKTVEQDMLFYLVEKEKHE
jgi:uncharacterized damage-inducible protein DinB